MAKRSRILRQYKLTQRVRIDAHRYLRLGVNYTYLPTRVPETDDFLDQHRIELEVIPRWPISPRLTLDLRNRLELRWLEGEPGLNERSRHRFRAAAALEHLGPLRSVYASNELFFDYGGAGFNQNRLIPLGLRFRASRHASFGTYYMLQSLNRTEGWDQAHVLGTHLAVSF